MVRWREGVVTGVRRRWRGAVELDVAVVARAGGDPATVCALAYTRLVGDPAPGERVLINLNALARGLGTGGYALVVAMPDRLPVDPPDDRLAGHIVKARYTPLQAMVLGTEEPASPHHASLSTAEDLGGMPVVTADLHSALPAVLAGVRSTRPDARVAYVMTDGGALPVWFSRTVSELGDLLAGTITVGQSFGGDLEAANVHSGLLAAHHALRADVTVVTQGPGGLGTGSVWGFSSTSVGEAVNAVAALGGRPVGALRISGADPRPRHRGLSHHSITAYGRVALAPADLVVPEPLAESTSTSAATLAAEVHSALAALVPPHRLVRVACDGLEPALRALPVTLSSMGRGFAEDPVYFLAAAAAGRHAARLLPTNAS